MAGILPTQAVLLSHATPRMRQAAQAFEAQALSQLLAPAFATVKPGQGLFGGGAGEDQWQPMLVDAMAKQIARAGGLGLARPVLTEMLRMQASRESSS